MGSFTQCGTDCVKTFLVSEQALNGGPDCFYEHGEEVDCLPGEGYCAIVSKIFVTQKFPIGTSLY